MVVYYWSGKTRSFKERGSYAGAIEDTQHPVTRDTHHSLGVSNRFMAGKFQAVATINCRSGLLIICSDLGGLPPTDMYNQCPAFNQLLAHTINIPLPNTSQIIN